MLLNTVFDLMNIINNYSNYHGVSEKKVKLITYIIKYIDVQLLIDILVN